MNKKNQNMNKKNSLAFLTAILAIISLVICLSVVLLIKSSREKNGSDTMQAQIKTTGSEINKANQEKEEMMVKLESVQKYLETLETAVSDSTLKINTLVEGEGEVKSDDTSEITKSSIQSLDNTNKNLLDNLNELMSRIDDMKHQVDEGITQLKDGNKSDNEKVVNNITELLAQFENLKNESQDTLKKIEESGESNKEDLELIVNNFERNFNKANAQNQSEIEENMKNTKIMISELREEVNSGFDNMSQMQQDTYTGILSEIKDALDQVFTLVANGKNKLASALATIGRNVSGNEVLSFSELEDYILHSQDIEGEYDDGVNGPILLSEVIENNLPKGKAAWANGKYVIGNGHDIEESFNTGHSEGYTEGYGKGYANGAKDVLEGVDIEYTYHVHSGEEGIYGGCYTEPIYHQHTDACYTNIYCHGRWERVAWLENGWWCDYRCTGCGAHRTGMEREQYSAPSDGGPHNAVIGRTLTCDKDKEITGYGLGCGKTTETVESVTINFDKIPLDGSSGTSNGPALAGLRTGDGSSLLNVSNTQAFVDILGEGNANALVNEECDETNDETEGSQNDKTDEGQNDEADAEKKKDSVEDVNAEDSNVEESKETGEEEKIENDEGLSENENAKEDKPGNENKEETKDTNTEDTNTEETSE